jgi:hypothetical protein
MTNYLTHDNGNRAVLEHKSTDEMLEAASLLSECHLHRIGKGWSLTIELETVVPGGEFKVRSEFGHATHRAAIKEALFRALSAVNGDGK